MSESMRKCSLITMSQGNVKVLGETFQSFSTFCDEIVYGDLLVLEADREVLKEYQKEFNLKVVKYPFNFIYKNGFSYFLNDLATYSTNNNDSHCDTCKQLGGGAHSLNQIVPKEVRKVC